MPRDNVTAAVEWLRQKRIAQKAATQAAKEQRAAAAAAKRMDERATARAAALAHEGSCTHSCSCFC
jgi:hypothetical protein